MCATQTVGLSAQPATNATAATWLPLDTLFSAGERIGCEEANASSVAPSGGAPDVARSREAWREAQAALLEGNRERAREQLGLAVTSDPRDARAWLELSSVQEALADSTASRTAACRVLALSSATTVQRDDAEKRWRRLLGSARTQRLDVARTQYAHGIRLARQRDWAKARAAFTDVVNALPASAGAWRNRAIVTAEAGDRRAAETDLARYLEMGAPAADRLAVARALSALRRPQFSTATATFAGLLPGGAQFYTRRTAFGVLTLSAAAGAVALSALPRTETRTIPYIDPNGQPAPYEERSRTYPYRTAGIAAGAGVLVAALIEGVAYAARSQRLPQFADGGGAVALRVYGGAVSHRSRGSYRLGVGITW